MDAVFHGGGDGTQLARLGTPLWLLVLLSLVLLSFGSASACLLMPRLGMPVEVPIATRLTILLAGIGPYLLSMWFYHCFFNRGELKLWTMYVVAGFVFLVLLAWISTLWDSWWPTMKISVGTPITWTTSVTMLAVGVGLVGLLLIRTDAYPSG